MSSPLTTEQVLALAPDAASAKAGRGLATPRSWVSVGRDAQAVWGECQGSGKTPYQTQIDLRGPAFRCSCPSRKFPCKHGLGLLLLLAAQPDVVAPATPPAWVAEWLASRIQREEQQQRRQAAADDPATAEQRAAKAAKSAAARDAKVQAGIAEVSRWLRDQVREGLAGIPARSPAVFDRMAARMVDAQAPGVARRLREMAAIPASGDGWQGRLLERMARLHLLVEGYTRLDTLSPNEQAEVRQAVGFNQKQEEVLAGAGQRDRWLVLGQVVEDEEPLQVQRTWLWAEAAARPALVLDFAAPGKPFDHSLVPGMQLDAELVFYPGALPLRALVKQADARMPASFFPSSDIHTALGTYAAALARCPWLERYPLTLGPVQLALTHAGWLVCDQAGHSLPLRPQFGRSWELLARSAGQPFSLSGEWDGDWFTPLSAWVGGFVDLVGGVL
ncbi:SWIM zinc finger domain protein [Oscillochloris trichoides DG-6]|uniref:SWIM zinc finger domain protein n=1 Tax=Oscillochloris trichoides DG-6 TaxID=765420 RepID=E1IDA4_9CHLR|nr:SWIM zinc finger family protein [Oscillochloris trichoides]EFO80781.1 SWIM zinc finger domain protein [Oscillochloris trichoides DG-6]